MAISITPVLRFTAIDTDDFEGVSDPQISSDEYNFSGTNYSTSTTTPVTKKAYNQFTLSSGSLTVDLTSITDAVRGAQDFSGLKVQTVVLQNPSSNANDITVAAGATNGYNLFGSSGQVTLSPGEGCGFAYKDNRPDVAAGAKNIDITGTGSQVLNMGLCAG